MQAGALETFRAAVAAIHSPDASATQTWREANAWLVAFSDDPQAASVCEAMLQSASASIAEQTFAAGILSRAASRYGAAGVGRLLQLCQTPACTQAVSSLAAAIAAATVAARAEESLLASPDFAQLVPPRRVVLLQALADSLCQCASVEELRYRPSSVAACSAAVGFLQVALLEQPQQPLEHAVDPAAALRCLASWAGCGVDWIGLSASFPSLAAALIAALEPRAIEVVPGGAPDASRLSHASLAATVVRACLQCALDADEEVTLEGCGPLLRTLALWVPSSSTPPHSAASSPAAPPRAASASPFNRKKRSSGEHLQQQHARAPLSVAMLGVPTLDAWGMSDGGGEHGDGCAELACGLGAIASLLLEATAESLDEAIASAALPTCDEATRSAARHVRSAIELLLACTSHCRAGPSEVAAEGWLYFAATQPMPVAEESWVRGLFVVVAHRTALRCSRAQLRQGTGDDDEDLEQWRARSAQPLLTACSELLGIESWLGPLAGAMGEATATTAGASVDLETLEALLFAVSCTSPRCVRACPAHVKGGLLHDVSHGVAKVAETYFTADLQMQQVALQAEACVAALACKGSADLEDDDE